MDNIDKAKLKAAGKIALGVGKGLSGVAIATGHGFIGAFYQKHHMTVQAARHARMSWESADQTIREGLQEWRDADSA